MAIDELDITHLLAWEDQVPRPQWDLLQTLIESHASVDSTDNRFLWTGALRQWLEQLAPAVRAGYHTTESENFLAVAWEPDRFGESLLPFAENCRRSLLSVLGGVANFELPGCQVVLAFRNADDYYRYISDHYPEGEHGGSGGVHIRDGYPHVVIYGKELLAILENSLAHELTHVSLHHLSMPQWLEEGLAQMFEHDMTNRSLLMVDSEMAARHKKYWTKKGLDEFWYGSGFSKPGKVQELSYQLAEILVRLFVEEAKPRWFGWDRGPQKRFLAFLQSARMADCGEAAISEHLGSNLGDLAVRFLGPGEWMPGVKPEDTESSGRYPASPTKGSN